MSFSIYNNIRSSKVTTGNAPQFHGMRTFDSSAQVCPARANVSDHGIVGVARDTINTYSAGCFNPRNRMEVENRLRPQYSTYLNADAIGMSGAGDSDMQHTDFEYQSRNLYDTQLGSDFVRPVLDRDVMYPVYKAKKMEAVNGKPSDQLKEANDIQCFMNRTFEHRDCDLY